MAHRCSNWGILALILVVASSGEANGALVENFYRSTCPQAEAIVRQITWNAVRSNPPLAAKLLRLHFHDCFVQGCDGSVLLDSTNGVPAEKDALPNLSLSGFDVIDQIKTALEQACPNSVSCADILALSARDAVSFQYRFPLWRVLTGRRDGSVSLASNALANLPSPFSGFSELSRLFNSKGLSNTDLVVLSGTCPPNDTVELSSTEYALFAPGGHTLGVAHCGTFSNRLYNFTGKGDVDPSLNPSYAAFLRTRCPNPADPSTTVELDPQSSLSFDAEYYRNLLRSKGLLTSDAALLTDAAAAANVRLLQVPGVFFGMFGTSMMKMGGVGVITGANGGIRANCRITNVGSGVRAMQAQRIEEEFDD